MTMGQRVTGHAGHGSKSVTNLSSLILQVLGSLDSLHVQYEVDYTTVYGTSQQQRRSDDIQVAGRPSTGVCADDVNAAAHARMVARAVVRRGPSRCECHNPQYLTTADFSTLFCTIILRFARSLALPSSSPLSQFLTLTPQNLPVLQLFPPVV